MPKLYINADDVNTQPYAFDTPFSADAFWRQSLKEIALKQCAAGPQCDGAEVNCHGLPGKLMLSPILTVDTLLLFAEGIRRIVRKGSTIEILACHVAAIPVGHLRAALARRDQRPSFAGNFDRYAALFDRYTAERDAISSRNASVAGKPGDPNASSGKALTAEEIERIYAYAIELGEVINADWLSEVEREVQSHVERYAAEDKAAGVPVDRAKLTKEVKEFLASFEYTRYAQEDLEPRNGAYFCSQLATLTGCTVRAADVVQWEEFAKGSQRVRPTSRGLNTKGYAFGNWEGHVIDFYPGGGVKYLGEAVRRVGMNAGGEHFTHWTGAA